MAGGQDSIKLKRKLGLINGVTLVVGTIIGSGIFVSPKGVLEMSSNSVGVSLLVWIACGLISLIGSLCYAELGTTFQQSGGDYAYIKVAFGDLPAFLQLWINLLIIRPTAQAVVAMTFANYVLQPVFSSCAPPSAAIKLLASFCILTLTYINVRSVRAATIIQDVFTAAKVIALIIIILTGIVLLCMGRTENYQGAFESSKPFTAGKISLAMYSGLFAYAGWNFLNFVTEELIEPEKNLPRAIYISITLVTLIYVLTNVAFFVVLSPIEIIASNAVAVTFADRYFGVMSWIMPIFVSLSCFGGVNGLLFTSGRMNFVGARDNQLPQFMAMIGIRRATPITAILSTTALSLLMLIPNDVYDLINYLSFGQWLSVGASICAMMHMRRVAPNMNRPIRLHWTLPSFFILICVFLLLLPLKENPRSLGIGIALICTGIPVHMIFVQWKTKPKSFDRFINNLTWRMQKLLLMTLQDSAEETLATNHDEKQENKEGEEVLLGQPNA